MEPKVFLNTKVSVNCGVQEVAGKKFGLELELEGKGVRLQDVAVRGWLRHNDNSLRGEAIEYITAGAKPLEGCEISVKELFKKFKENGVKFKDSIRTSTHVHLNFSDKTAKQAINFYSLFTLLEEVLQYYSGEDRRGNLFCISSREAEGVVGSLAKDISGGSFRTFAGDRYKYAACNLSTLYKFGTIEVRTMRGANTAEQVNDWLHILSDMYDYAVDRMISPAGLVVRLSELGAEGLMREIFTGKSYKELLSTFPAHTLHHSLMEGARLIQVFAYEFDDAFTAKVSVPKAEKGHHVLGAFMPDGRNYIIWKPDGKMWSVRNNHGGNWRHGDEVVDDARIVWDARLGVFVVPYPEGDRVACRWASHHNPELIGRQPPAGLRRAMPGRRRRAGEVEPAPMLDDFAIDDFFDEGDED